VPFMKEHDYMVPIHRDVTSHLSSRKALSLISIMLGIIG
jgi:hypothetical protein